MAKIIFQHVNVMCNTAHFLGMTIFLTVSTKAAHVSFTNILHDGQYKGLVTQYLYTQYLCRSWSCSNARLKL